MDWQHPALLIDRPREANLGTWTWKYIPELIGKDKLPTGKQRTELSPRQIDASYRAKDYDWYWKYIPELVGKDKLPTGKQHTELAPGSPIVVWYRTWEVNLLETTLKVTFKPFLQTDWPLPRAPQPIEQTWTWRYNLNLIGQDQLPVGELVYDLPPRPHHRQPDLTSWTWNYNVNLIGQDAMTVGEQFTDRPPTITWYQSWTQNLLQSTLLTQPRPFSQFDWPLPGRFEAPRQSWTWQYNLDLIGQDKMIVGDQITDRPPTVTWYQSWTQALLQSTLAPLPTGQQVTDRPPTFTWYHSWILNLLQGTLTPAVVRPFVQADWPLPRDPREVRSWIWNYNLNLIGQDALPVGELVYDLPPRGYPPLVPTWTWNYNVNLIGQDRMTVGDQVTDLWPRAPQRPSNLDTWLWQYNLNLIGKDRVPGKIITDLPPRDYPERYRSWTWQYLLDLIGQDAMTVGDQFTDRPPTISWLLGFTQNLLQSTLAPVTTKPFLQTDWPLTPAPQPASPSWTWNYNVNLIGQDAMIVGDQVTDLPPRPHHRQPDLTSWTWSYNRNLIGKDALPVGEIYTALAPVGPQQPERTWISATVAFLQTQQAPFAQFDWPNPRAPLRASSLDTWIDQTKILLIPAAPFRQNDWPVPPPLTQPDRGFSAKYNPNLIAQDVFPPGARFTDLSPIGYFYPPDLRSFLVSPAVPPVPPPPPTTEFHSMPFFATPGQLKSW